MKTVPIKSGKSLATNTIIRTYRESPKSQWARELIINALEAILGAHRPSER